MSTDKKNTEDQVSGEKTSPQEATDMDEVIDLVEATDSNDSLAMDIPDLELSSGENEEDLIELTDVFEEYAQEAATGDTVIGGESAAQQDSEEEQSIELVDEVENEPEAEEQEVFELADVADVVEERDSEAEEEEAVELSEVALETDEFEEESYLEDLDLEMPDEGAETGVDEVGEEISAMSEEFKGVPAQPTDEALESTLLEKLSDDRIEAIIRRVVTETIEKKADHVLLEVAEAAIAKEIERLKQAL